MNRRLTNWLIILAFAAATFFAAALVMRNAQIDLNRIPVISGLFGFGSGRPDFAIGELGGHAVSIPRDYADFLEYDGDPHWLEGKSLLQLKRTFASKISSFGFYIRYPEMEVRTDANRQEMHKESIYTSMWLFVGVLSNSTYGLKGDMALETYIRSIPIDKTPGYGYRYEKIPETTYGLIGYTPIGVDESLRDRRRGTHHHDKNIYYHRNAEGKADAYIVCSNSKHAAAPCEMRLNLVPHMRAHVSVSFRKGLLPHWQEIRSAVSRVILGFRATANPIRSIPK